MYQVIFNSGFIGFLIWLLLFAVSTAGLAIAIRCGWILRKRLFINAGSHGEIIPLLKRGDWQGAFERCEADSSLVGRILKEILLSAHEKTSAERQEIAAGMLDRRVKEVLRQINTLAMCGNIAPMLGLLGTVTGMVDAFMGLGTTMGPEKASVLAIAISQALYTTATGLLVAIPAITYTVIFRNTLEKRIELVTDMLEQALSHIPELEPEPKPERKAYHNTETAKLEV